MRREARRVNGNKVFQLGFSLAAQAQNYCGLNKIKIDLVSRPGLEW